MYRYRNSYRYVCIYGLSYIIKYVAVNAESQKDDISIAMSTPSTQILVSKYHSLIKGTRAP